jgi:hypothetical protein
MKGNPEEVGPGRTVDLNGTENRNRPRWLEWRVGRQFVSVYERQRIDCSIIEEAIQARCIAPPRL